MVSPEMVQKWGLKMARSTALGTCVVCGKIKTRTYTCSKECHERFLEDLVHDFGEYVHITDLMTGAIHLVPRMVLLNEGLRYEDLKKYPVVEASPQGLT